MHIHPVVHVRLAKPHITNPRALADEIPTRPEIPEENEKGENLFAVSKILGHRKRGRGYQWLTLLEEAAKHEAERQPTKDFVDADGTLTAVFPDYVKEHALLPNLLRLSKQSEANATYKCCVGFRLFTPVDASVYTNAPTRRRALLGAQRGRRGRNETNRLRLRSLPIVETTRVQILSGWIQISILSGHKNRALSQKVD